MNIKKFESYSSNNKDTVYHYVGEKEFTITDDGKLLLNKFISITLGGIFLTYDEYLIIKPFADLINQKCENYNDMKRTEIKKLKTIISKVKDDSKIKNYASKYNM